MKKLFILLFLFGCLQVSVAQKVKEYDPKKVGQQFKSRADELSSYLFILDSTSYLKYARVNKKPDSSRAYKFIPKPDVTSLLYYMDQHSNRQLGKALYTPLATSNNPFVSNKTNVSLESQFGDQFASATVGFSSRNLSIDAVLKQPFQEKPKEVNPFSLDGLDNGSSFKLGFQWNISYLKKKADIQKIYSKTKEKFYQHRFRNIPCDSLVTLIKDGKESFFLKNGEKLISIDSLKKQGCCCEVEKQLGLKAAYMLDSLTGSERDEAAALNLNDLDDAARKDLFEAIYVKRWFIGASMSIAKTSFDYIRDSFSLVPTFNETHINRSYKANIGYIFNSENEKKISVMALTFSYSRGFEAGSDPVDYSFPVGTQGLNYKKNLTIGIPSQSTNTRVGFEFRKKWNLFSEHPLAISPSISYLFNKNALAVVMPLYIFQYKKDDKLAGLQGGLRFGYRTSTNSGRLTSFSKGFSASIFISAPFDMLSF